MRVRAEGRTCELGHALGSMYEDYVLAGSGTLHSTRRDQRMEPSYGGGKVKPATEVAREFVTQMQGRLFLEPWQAKNIEIRLARLIRRVRTEAMEDAR